MLFTDMHLVTTYCARKKVMGQCIPWAFVDEVYTYNWLIKGAFIGLRLFDDRGIEANFK